jgi:hypothetical protein
MTKALEDLRNAESNYLVINGWKPIDDKNGIWQVPSGNRFGESAGAMVNQNSAVELQKAVDIHV